MLIVIEGLDGCGKGTQIELLKQKFPELVVFKYPTRKFSILNDYLEKRIELDRKALFLLFLADIAEEQKKIAELLKQGKIVLLDRYVFSTISYEFDAFTYEQAKRLVESAKFLKPDKVILLDIDGKTSHERKSKQKQLDRYEENVKYLEEVRGHFLNLANDKLLCKNWIKIDASKSIEIVQKQLLELF
ncbi:MAG: dTMP kinase [Candidatus Micrarchaeota archaeon]